MMISLAGDRKGTLREEHSISVSPSIFWSDSIVALRTSRVSLSPSTTAWHSRFSFSEIKKGKGHSLLTQTPVAAQQQQHTDCLQAQLQAARIRPFLERAISLSGICTRVCTEQLLFSVPAGFKTSLLKIKIPFNSFPAPALLALR